MNTTQLEGNGEIACLILGPDDILGKQLLTYDIASDGSFFRMSFIRADGERSSLTLPADCIQALMMTLPRMMEKALKARHGDDNLRLVYPAETVLVEGSQVPNTFIVSLTTPDGFEVSFSLSETQLEALRDPKVSPGIPR